MTALVMRDTDKRAAARWKAAFSPMACLGRQRRGTAHVPELIPLVGVKCPRLGADRETRMVRRVVRGSGLRWARAWVAREVTRLDNRDMDALTRMLACSLRLSLGLHLQGVSCRTIRTGSGRTRRGKGGESSEGSVAQRIIGSYPFLSPSALEGQVGTAYSALPHRS
jgi:hypothetical protein